jgi:hypothetical protein
MDVNGDLIRLDRNATSVLYEPEDWELVEGHCMIRHKPTSCIFEIDCDDDAKKSRVATVFQFFARLVHVCNHRALPSAKEQVPLGRAAIAVFLQAIGAWKPVVRHVPGPRARRHPKRCPRTPLPR